MSFDSLPSKLTSGIVLRFEKNTHRQAIATVQTNISARGSISNDNWGIPLAFLQEVY